MRKPFAAAEEKVHSDVHVGSCSTPALLTAPLLKFHSPAQGAAVVELNIPPDSPRPGAARGCKDCCKPNRRRNPQKGGRRLRSTTFTGRARTSERDAIHVRIINP